MYKTKIRATEQPITVNIERLAAMLSCGCATARKIGEQAGAKIVIPGINKQNRIIQKTA